MIKEILKIKEGYKKMGYGGSFLDDVTKYEYKTNKIIRKEMLIEKLRKKLIKAKKKNRKH